MTNEYTARLGKATRAYLKRYTVKIARSFPSFTHKTYVDEDIDEQQVRDIINMSKARMENKKKKFALDEGGARGLIKLAKECGLVNAVLINDRLCAGSINYRVGSHHFLFINAHDPDYDEYRLGTICYYLTICESIIRGSKTFHMGRARYEYKHRLLGVQQDFDRLVIYRSYRQLMLHVDCVAKTALRGYLRQLKLWLLDPKRHNSVISRFAIGSLYILRRLRKKD